ncbi:MAG: hypothetical protein HLX51_03530 [Micrococcaceae bacterium]|nr:hypothetical protein [Micrococcaceae bacterium]
MTLISGVVFIVAMLFLVSAIGAVVVQLLRGGVKAIRTVPAVPLMAGYVVTFLVWLAL